MRKPREIKLINERRENKKHAENGNY